MLIRNVQVAHNFFTILLGLYNPALVRVTQIVTWQVCHQAYLPGCNFEET